jgi:hypothetical protein
MQKRKIIIRQERTKNTPSRIIVEINNENNLITKVKIKQNIQNKTKYTKTKRKA